MKALLAAALLSFSSLLVVGCAADTSSGAPTTSVPEEEDLTKAGPLSQPLVCAAVKAATDHQDGSGLKSVAQSALKGDALKDFKAWQKGMVSDYPSSAYELPVPLGKKTYTFWLVLESNDGGGAIGVYRTDGRAVATDLYSESEDNGWSAPADKCPTE